MAVCKKDIVRGNRRCARVRAHVKSVSSRPRVSVHRTLQNIYAQIIDDATHKTLVSFSSQQLEGAQGDKTAVARLVGIELAKRAKEQNVITVVFDRGRFLYHGRVKALADGLREGGLTL